MKNKTIVIIISILVIFVMTGFLILCQKDNQIQKPDDFNFIFRYGVGGKNEIDTFKGTYTKDMVTEPSITIDFKLSDSEMEGVYKKIEELEIFNITEKNKDNLIVTPCNSYYLKVQSKSEVKDISWDNCSGTPNERLTELSDYITSIIESYEEVKNLPVPEGAYL